MTTTTEAMSKAREALEMSNKLFEGELTDWRLKKVQQALRAVNAALSSAEAQPDELRRAVRTMTASLNDGEWAEHVSSDDDAQALECAITELIGKAAPQSSQPIGQPLKPASAEDQAIYDALSSEQNKASGEKGEQA